MHRCKVLLLTLATLVGLGLATGCDEGANEETSDEQASAAPAEEQAKADQNEQADDAEPPLEATGPVAVVDGTEIAAERFNEAVGRRAGAMGGQMPPRLAEMMKQRTIDRLIDEHLIDQELANSDVKVDQKEVETEFNKFKERFPNEDAFQAFLTRNGIDVDEMKENLGKDLRLRALLEQKYGVEVTEADAKKYYDENPERFKQEEQVHARHILIKTEKDADEAALADAKKRAEALAAEAKKPGADFAKLAEEKSEGPSASRGGDLGFFTRQRMVPEFSEAAFKMKAGEISEPVKTQFGYHVIKVEDKKDAGTVSYDEAKEKIVTQLERKSFRESMEKFLGELKEGKEIVRNEDNVKVNATAPAQGQGGPHGMGNAQQMQLQKQIQEQLKKKAAQQQEQGGDEQADPTKLKLQQPKLGQ